MYNIFLIFLFIFILGLGMKSNESRIKALRRRRPFNRMENRGISREIVPSTTRENKQPKSTRIWAFRGRAVQF